MLLLRAIGIPHYRADEDMRCTYIQIGFGELELEDGICFGVLKI
jgi:hypothetical protein